MEVLRRPSLRGRYAITEQDVEDVLLLLAPFLPSVDIEVPLRDAEDIPVVASAVVGRVDAIVTGDHDLMEPGPLRDWLAARDIKVLTPAQVVDRLT